MSLKVWPTTSISNTTSLSTLFCTTPAHCNTSSRLHVQVDTSSWNIGIGYYGMISMRYYSKQHWMAVGCSINAMLLFVVIDFGTFSQANTLIPQRPPPSSSMALHSLSKTPVPVNNFVACHLLCPN